MSLFQEELILIFDTLSNKRTDDLSKTKVFHTTTIRNLTEIYENGINPVRCSNFLKVGQDKNYSYYFWEKPSYYPNDKDPNRNIGSYEDYPVVISFNLEDIIGYIRRIFAFDTGAVLSGVLEDQLICESDKQRFSPSIETIETYELDINLLAENFQVLFDSDRDRYQQGTIDLKNDNAYEYVSLYSKLLNQEYVMKPDDRLRTFEIILDKSFNLKDIDTRVLYPKLFEGREHEDRIRNVIDEILQTHKIDIDMAFYYCTPQTDYHALSQLLKAESHVLKFAPVIIGSEAKIKGEVDMLLYEQEGENIDDYRYSPVKYGEPYNIVKNIISEDINVLSKEKMPVHTLTKSKIHEYNIRVSLFRKIKSFKITNELIIISEEENYLRTYKEIETDNHYMDESKEIEDQLFEKLTDALKLDEIFSQGMSIYYYYLSKFKPVYELEITPKNNLLLIGKNTFLSEDRTVTLENGIELSIVQVLRFRKRFRNLERKIKMKRR